MQLTVARNALMACSRVKPMSTIVQIALSGGPLGEGAGASASAHNNHVNVPGSFCCVDTAPLLRGLPNTFTADRMCSWVNLSTRVMTGGREQGYFEKFRDALTSTSHEPKRLDNIANEF